MPRSATLKYELALLATIVIWGFNFPILKAALAAMHLHALNAIRLSVSASVLGVIYVVRQRNAGQSVLAPMRTHGLRLIGLGLVGYLFYQYCFIVGIDRTSAGSAALIMASSPLWTAVFGHVFRFDFLRGLGWTGLLTTLIGACVIVLGGAKTIALGNNALLGNLIILLGAVFWGAYTAFSKPLSREITPTGITFLGLLFALPFLYALGIPYFDTVAWDQIDTWVWFAILYSGALSTGVAVIMWNTAVKHVGPSHTAASGNLVPVIALLSSAWLLDERISMIQLLGGGLILGGLFVMRRARRPLAIAPP